MISIYVKLLSGDMVEVLLNEETTYYELYTDVYDALPEGVYPDAIWQLTLTRQTQEGEYEEVPDTDEKANPQEGEMFCACIETRWVELEEQLKYKQYDAFLDDPTAVSENDWLYTRSELCLLINGGEKAVRDYFLYHPDTGRYYLSRGVEEVEWFGRFEEEFLFRFTERTDGFATREEMMDGWLSQWGGYSNRTKAHVKREWMEVYQEDSE